MRDPACLKIACNVIVSKGDFKEDFRRWVFVHLFIYSFKLSTKQVHGVFVSFPLL